VFYFSVISHVRAALFFNVLKTLRLWNAEKFVSGFYFSNSSHARASKIKWFVSVLFRFYFMLWEPLKWVLMNFEHDRPWFNTLIPPSHESAAVTGDCISRLSGPVRLILRYTTPDIHCRDRRYEWGGGKHTGHLSIACRFSTLWNHLHWNSRVRSVSISNRISITEINIVESWNPKIYKMVTWSRSCSLWWQFVAGG